MLFSNAEILELCMEFSDTVLTPGKGIGEVKLVLGPV